MKTASIRLATWNLNNRVGKVRFRPEAAHAAVALGADFIVFTEYFPPKHDRQFCQVLAESGWMHQLISDEPDDPDEKANRTLIASRLPLVRDGFRTAPTSDLSLRRGELANQRRHKVNKRRPASVPAC
ncbi:MAG TPA: hypothetical protein VGG61_11930 [Gemmataceae bacterium]